MQQMTEQIEADSGMGFGFYGPMDWSYSSVCPWFYEDSKWFWSPPYIPVVDYKYNEDTTKFLSELAILANDMAKVIGEYTPEILDVDSKMKHKMKSGKHQHKDKRNLKKLSEHGNSQITNYMTEIIQKFDSDLSESIVKLELPDLLIFVLQTWRTVMDNGYMTIVQKTKKGQQTIRKYTHKYAESMVGLRNYLVLKMFNSYGSVLKFCHVKRIVKSIIMDAGKFAEETVEYIVRDFNAMLGLTMVKLHDFIESLDTISKCNETENILDTV
jgi:hypothetical protein